MIALATMVTWMEIKTLIFHMTGSLTMRKFRFVFNFRLCGILFFGNIALHALLVVYNCL